jgi:DNA-binding transcriptional MerR regulator
MKLSDYLPETPALAQTMTDLNAQIGMFQLMKESGDIGTAPTMGLDHVVNTWVRHQMAYRQQLVMDIQTIAMSVEEIRSPISHITSEVFRRGIQWKAKIKDPDHEQQERFGKFLEDCNVFDQSLEEVLKQFHYDINTVDDGFLYLAKEYKSMEDDTLRSKIVEIRRLNPALVEFDLDTAGLPKNSHFICPIHRDEVQDTPQICDQPNCTRLCQAVMYKYYHRNKHIYLFDNEVIHITKFSPSETYGWSPILTVFEKALTLIGMDKNLYRYFFERKMPASMIMVFTDDPESLRRERSNMAAQTRMDPNFVPMVAVSARNNRGRVDMVRLFHTLQEMDYLPVRQEVRERIAAMWGVTPAWQGAPEAFGGLSTQTQQLVVMSRVVEGDQRMFHDKVFPILLEAFGITDWTLELPTPEEKAEATRISFAQQRVSVASQLNQMGFTVRLQDQGANLEEIAFVIEGESVPMTQFQGESQALQIEQTMQQMEQQEQQQQMQQQQQEMMGGASPEGGEEGEDEDEDDDDMVQAQLAQEEEDPDEDDDEELNDPDPDMVQ